MVLYTDKCEEENIKQSYFISIFNKLEDNISTIESVKNKSK